MRTVTYNIAPLLATLAAHVVTAIRLGDTLAAVWADTGGLFGKQLSGGLLFLETLNLCRILVELPAGLAVMPRTLMSRTSDKAAVVANHLRVIALVGLTAATVGIRTRYPMAWNLGLLLEVLVALVDFRSGVLFDVVVGKFLWADGASKQM